MASKEIANWADDFMFKAAEIDPDAKPEVYLLSCNNDPLGSIAAAAKAYKGEFVQSLAEVTEDERSYYLEQIQKTALEMPLEAVNFQFRIKGIHRGITHQMVRQRTAAYSQESTRFAVKETVPVARPPWLKDTLSFDAWVRREKEYLIKTFDPFVGEQEWTKIFVNGTAKEMGEYIEKHASKKQKHRFRWDNLMKHIEKEYNYFVNDGMPAEDARGALPTNLLTQINYHVNMRNLKSAAGARLCTQAQFEWRELWAQIVEAIRNYGENQWYDVYVNYVEKGDKPVIDRKSSAWQFEELSRVFKPICYQAGKCTMKADFDRKCSIRERVDANARIARPSTEWGQDYVSEDTVDILNGNHDIINTKRVVGLGIPAIHPAEWLLDPAAAR